MGNQFLMREAPAGLKSGKAMQPLRSVNALPHSNFFGAKIITAFSANKGTRYPSHMGYVMMFEREHGSVRDLLTDRSIRGSLGGVLLDRVPDRQSKKEITLFDALGLAVEDVICGKHLCCGEA